MLLTKNVKPGKDGYELTRGDYGVPIRTLHRCVWNGDRWIELIGVDYGKPFAALPKAEQEYFFNAGQWMAFDPDFGWL